MKLTKCPKCGGNECHAIIEEVDIGVGVQEFLSGYECRACGQIGVCPHCGACDFQEHYSWCQEKESGVIVKLSA